MTTNTWDAIVVGAGFAGAAAARELRWAGRSVLLVEARDRAGGRTYTARRDGQQVELGGAFVHWWQGQAITEVQRYGLAVEFVPFLGDVCLWPGVNGQERGDTAALRARIVPLLERFFAGAEAILPRPFEPLLPGQQSAFDDLSVSDRLDQLELDPADRRLLEGTMCSMASGTTRDVGFLSMVRWLALHRWDEVHLMDREHYRLIDGTAALMNAILGDAGCEQRFDTPVAAVEQGEDEAVVITRSGEHLHARQVVLAVPLNALKGIALPSDVPAAWHDAADHGAGSRGVKVLMRAAPGAVSTFAIGPEDAPLSWLITESIDEAGATLVAFGSDGGRIDGNDLDAVRAAVARIAPDLEITQAMSHDWLTDEFARGTWGFLRPGQLTRSLGALQRPHGRLRLAGADISDGWVALMSGAIESGIRVGRQIHRSLGA
jgi:monoamine oxidase